MTNQDVYEVAGQRLDEWVPCEHARLRGWTHADESFALWRIVFASDTMHVCLDCRSLLIGWTTRRAA